MKRRYITRSLAVATLLLFIGAGVGLVAFQARDGKFLSVQTGSMESHIPRGALVAVTKVSTDHLAVGNVITFTNPADKRQTITHRIIGTQPSKIAGAKPHFITKGDANPQPDAPVLAKSVVGKVSFGVPYMGFALDFVRKPAGLLLAIYVPALTVIVAEIRRLIAYYKSQEPYVLPELLAKRKRRSGRAAKMAVPGSVLSVLVLLGAGILAAPAEAALLSTVGLTSNTITSAIETPTPQPEPGRGAIHLRKVFFTRKSRHHRRTYMYVLVYNSRRKPVDLSGWKLKSSDRTVFTFPPHTSIRGKRTYVVKIPVPRGASQRSGKLTLYNKAHKKVDKIAWGR